MRFIGEGAAVLAALCWTLASLSLERWGKAHSPWALNALTKFFGLLAVSLLALLANGRLVPPATPTQWVFLLLSGLLGFSLGDGFLFAAFQSLGARKTLLVFSANPILSALLGWALFGEALGLIQALGILIAVGGIMWVIQSDLGSAAGPAEPGEAAGKGRAAVPGLLFAAIATLGQAGGTMLSKAGLYGLDAVSASQIRLLGGAAGLMVLLPLLRQCGSLPAVLADRKGRLAVASSVILGTLLGIVLSMLAIKTTQVAVATILMSLMPVMILPVSALLLREKVSPREALGAVVTLAGVSLLFL